ncbi:sugar phosphate isomerase/epimerase family protein [Paenibacillus physcomitrellae]|uniref:Sugar phosphate isomerase n=1 Tax=Paenibacillus physcomitrellae TaxID=1619311 RepID=A0ABQ1FN04_9BACL|nr:sugar phosphate isomerase/epimerase [Paenibacillus physcomitrellae]GGA22067.1 sugar phosphate isomerase [Paenibacillus physcomitrellae]
MAKIALQLYTVREQMEQDFEGTLRKVAELGYQGVEFAGFYGRTKEQVKALLEENGLTAVGAHTSLDLLLNHLDEQIEINQFIGNNKLIVPYVAEQDRNRWPEIIADIKRVAETCSAKGITLMYHNHDFELTQQLDGETVLDTIFEAVPASLLEVELDSCWVEFAGFDAVSYIEKYKGRMPLLHLKDVKKKEDGSPETVELGAGELDIKRIADAAIEADVEWLIVEQDYTANGAINCITTSMDWVKNYVSQGGKLNV